MNGDFDAISVTAERRCAVRTEPNRSLKSRVTRQIGVHQEPHYIGYFFLSARKVTRYTVNIALAYATAFITLYFSAKMEAPLRKFAHMSYDM